MLAGFIVLILVSLLSMLNAADIENSIRRIRKLLNFILLIPIFMALVSMRVNLVKPFLAGACIGGFVLLAITVYQGNFLGIARTPGFYNAIMFGSIAVITALALFVSLLLIKSKKIYIVVISLSLLCALVATVQSGTRGAWLGFIVGVPLGLCLSLIAKETPRQRIVLAVITSILLVSIVGISAKDEITARWEATVQYIDNTRENRDDDGNIGIRLIMWDAAVKIWYRHPIIGTGIGDYQDDYLEMINSGEAGFPGVETTPYSYAHSTLFEALAGTGALGLVVLILATFILPIVFFLKGYKTSKNEWDRYASVFGLVFISAFMIFGLTENWLVHKQLVMTFSLLLAIMASRFSAQTE